MSFEDIGTQERINMYRWRTLILVAGIMGALLSLVSIVKPSLGWPEFTVPSYGLVFASSVVFTFFCWKMDSRSSEESDEDYAVLFTHMETKRWFALSLIVAVLVFFITGLSVFAIGVYTTNLCWIFDRRYMSDLEEKVSSNEETV